MTGHRSRALTLALVLTVLAAACTEDSQTGPGAIVVGGDGGATPDALAKDTAANTDAGAGGADTGQVDTGNTGVDAGSGTVVVPAGVQLLAPAPGALHFAVGAAQVYWTSPASQQVLRVGYGGGKVDEVSKEVGINSPGDIAISDGVVYWAATNPTLYFIRRFDEATGAKGTVLTAKPELAPQVIDDIQADASHVYYTTGGNPAPNYTGLLRRVELGAGTAVTLKSWQKEPVDLVLHGEHIYWATRMGPAVQRAKKNGSQAEVLVDQVTGAVALTVDGTFVWWANVAGLSVDMKEGSIMRAPVQGGAPVTVATKQLSPVAMASGTNHVWWVNQGSAAGAWKNGQLVRFERSGTSAPEVIADSLHRPIDLAVAQEALWWLTRGSTGGDIGGLFRLEMTGL